MGQGNVGRWAIVGVVGGCGSWWMVAVVGVVVGVVVGGCGCWRVLSCDVCGVWLCDAREEH